MRSLSFTGVVLICSLLVPSGLGHAGQQHKRTATVTSAAPLHGFPPPAPGLALRTIPAGTTVVILEERDGWLSVEYVDATRTRHVGWMPRTYAEMPPASTTQKPAPPAQVTPPPPPKPAPPPRPATPPQTKTEPEARPVPQKPTPVTPVRPRPPLSVSALAGWEATSLAAAETFEALLGSPRTNGFAAGGQVDGLYGGLFVRGSVSFSNSTAERAFVIEGERISVGIPLEISMMPIEITAGWRFRPRPRPRPSRYSLHVGGGLALVRYSETTTEFAEPDDNVRKTYPGLVLHGGSAIDLSRRLFIGADVRFRTVSTPLTEGTLSADLGESDLGGIALRVGFGIRIK